MRLLLIQFCTVFSLVAFSQKPNKNNEVILAGMPQSGTYSIQFKYSDGAETPMGGVNAHLESMFPQLRSLKLVNKGGDIIVNITASEHINLFDARDDETYGPMVSNYNRYWPLPKYSESGIPGYFRPLTISIENNGKSLYQLHTIGLYWQGKASKFNKGLEEKKAAASSLKFMHEHFYQLAGG